MPKMKTSKSAAKRFRTTATGKIKRKKAFAQHMFASKSPKRKRQLRTSAFVSSADRQRIQRQLPYA